MDPVIEGDILEWLQAIPGAVRAASARAMRAGARATASKIQNRASFSKRIPGAITVQEIPTGAEIVVDGSEAPDAMAIENRGRGFVSHPTFGHAPITNKNSHAAFIQPSVDEAIGPTLDGAAEQVGRAIESP